jgi:hypothetical protein
VTKITLAMFRDERTLERWIKDKLSNKQDETFSETKQKFMMLTNNQKFPYQI